MKTLIALVAGLFLTVAPAFAQHGGGHPVAHGNGPYHSSESHNESRPEKQEREHFEGDRGRHTTPEARGHFDGRHFDRDHYDHYFGRGHVFVIGQPVIIAGFPRFFYGGFWFSINGLWPVDWCYCDQVYIDYDVDSDCYYVYNPYHPGVRVIIGVVL